MSRPRSNISLLSSSRATRSLHTEPPLTPRGVLVRHSVVIWIVAGFSLALALAAAADSGSVLLTWDEPIQLWIEDHRTATLESMFRIFSRLGSNIVIFGAFAIIVAIAVRRCRTLA